MNYKLPTATGITLSKEQLDRLFPFHIKTDRKLNIQTFGEKLIKLLKNSHGQSLFKHFHFKEPMLANTDTEADLLLCKRVELVVNKNTSIVLAGEFEYLEQADEYIFIAVPALNSATDLPVNNFAFWNLDAMGESNENDASDTDKEIKAYAVNKDTNSELYIISKIAEENINGILIMNQSGSIQWTNKAFQDITGYTLEEVKGKRPRETIYGPESTYVKPDFVDRKVAEKKPFTFENIGYTKAKRKFWLKAVVYPIFDENNDVCGRFSIFEDITQEKLKELELQESRELWQFALEGAGHGVWIFDNKTRVIKLSPQVKKLLGYGDSDTFTSNEWYAAMHPEDYAMFISEIYPRLSVEEPNFTHKHRLACKDGIYRYFISRGSVTDWDQNEKPLITAGTLSDINELIEKDLELQSTTIMLSSLIQNLNEGILLENVDRKIIFVNEKFLRKFGIPSNPEQMIGYDCAEAAEQTKYLFKNPDDFLRRVEQILTNRLKVVDEKIELADGRVMQRDYIPVFLGEQYMGHLWKYKDITIQYNFENQIITQREYYHNILNNIPVDIVILTPEHRFEFINHAAVKNVEMRRWMIGKTNAEYCELKKLPPSFNKNREDNFKRAVETGRQQKLIEEHTKADGSPLHMLRIMHPHADADGKVDFVIGYGIDITDQILNEQKIITQEKRIRNFLDIINDGVFRCDADGTVNLHSNSFLSVIGVNKLPLKSEEKLNFFKLLPANELKKIRSVLDTLGATGQPQFGTFLLTSPDGHEKYIDFTFTLPIKQEDAAFIGRISDITETMNREQTLKEIINKEKELNTTKSHLIHITSHELRTPLTIIQSNAEILSMIVDPDPAKTRNIDSGKLLDRITREVTLMTEILNQLTTVSRIETNKIELKTETVSLADFVGELRQDLYEPYTDGRTLQVKGFSAKMTFQFDKKLMRMAIINLVNNAFKYSARMRPPLLSLALKNKELIISIEDFGIGIPEEDKANLFQSFYRASNVGVIQGTGLGLMVAEYAVRRHKGKITFCSTLNKGTIFTITLPDNTKQ